MVNSAIIIGGHGIEAAICNTSSVSVEVPSGFSPATDRNQGFNVMFLFVRCQCTEMTFEAQSWINLYAWPFLSCGDITWVVDITNIDLAVRTDVHKTIVDMGEFIPWYVVNQVVCLRVVTRTPAGKVANYPAWVIRSHNFTTLVIINRAIRDIESICLVEAIRTTLFSILQLTSGGKHCCRQAGTAWFTTSTGRNGDVNG